MSLGAAQSMRRMSRKRFFRTALIRFCSYTGNRKQTDQLGLACQRECRKGFGQPSDWEKRPQEEIHASPGRSPAGDNQADAVCGSDGFSSKCLKAWEFVRLEAHDAMAEQAKAVARRSGLG